MLVRSQTAATKNIFHGYLDTRASTSDFYLFYCKSVFHAMMMRRLKSKMVNAILWVNFNLIS